MIDGDTDFAPGTRDFRLMLHEIGHAMGLSHSADGTFTLAGDLDNLKNTVMTYNLPGGASITTKLGKLDHKALAYLYGDASGTKGWNVSTKGDAVKIVASNRGETRTAILQESGLLLKDLMTHTLAKDAQHE